MGVGRTARTRGLHPSMRVPFRLATRSTRDAECVGVGRTIQAGEVAFAEVAWMGLDGGSRRDRGVRLQRSPPWVNLKVRPSTAVPHAELWTGHLRPDMRSLAWRCSNQGATDRSLWAAMRQVSKGSRSCSVAARPVRAMSAGRMPSRAINRAAACGVLATSAQRIGPWHFGQCSRSARNTWASSQAQR